MRRVFGLFARFSGVLGRPPDRDPCWGPRYFLLGTPVVASVLTLPALLGSHLAWLDASITSSEDSSAQPLSGLTLL